jgi:hypothetical protein
MGKMVVLSFFSRLSFPRSNWDILGWVYALAAYEIPGCVQQVVLAANYDSRPEAAIPRTVS